MLHDPDNKKLERACIDYCPKCRALGLQIAVSDSEDYTEKAKRLVFEQVKSLNDLGGQHPTFSSDEIKIVWFAKVLQNWKAIVITTLPDGFLYEVTYDGNLGQAYIDTYIKQKNVTVVDEAPQDVSTR